MCGSRWQIENEEKWQTERMTESGTFLEISAYHIEAQHETFNETFVLL